MFSCSTSLLSVFRLAKCFHVLHTGGRPSSPVASLPCRGRQVYRQDYPFSPLDAETNLLEGSCSSRPVSDDISVLGSIFSIFNMEAFSHSMTTWPLHSQRILSAHSTSATRVAGVAKLAFLLARSASRTPRAREQAVQTWMLVPSSIVFARISASGGHPTGTTASETQLRISPTASPSMKICTSWLASAKALAWRKGNAALVGSSDPHALLIRTQLISCSFAMACCSFPSRIIYLIRRNYIPDGESAGKEAPKKMAVRGASLSSSTCCPHPDGSDAGPFTGSRGLFQQAASLMKLCNAVSKHMESNCCMLRFFLRSS